MPCEPEMADDDLVGVVLYGLARDRDCIDVEIAEKRIQLYDLQGGTVQSA
ncbi:MAG: hypothetical protein ABSG65_33910 [Bryobacteraceae bacterium]|jgi:hypothetical protein